MRDVGLLLVHDASEHDTWLDIWACAYPETAQVFVSSQQNFVNWQQSIQAAYQSLPTDNVAVVAHGMGAVAVLAWYDQLHMAQYARVVAMVLVAPIQAALVGELAAISQRTRFTPKTALVCAAHDDFCDQTWAQQQANRWQARFFSPPQHGHLNQPLHGFEWGMCLLQEMIL